MTRIREALIVSAVTLALLWLLLANAGMAWPRDRNVALDFQRLHPCPSTGKTSGACPGWVRDHVIPLCKGGPDTVANLQWQTIEAAKAKDRWECRP